MTTSSQRPSLDEVAREHGDPNLFPRDIVRLHAQGEARRAQRELLRHAKRFEPDQRRAERQRAAAADLRLWLEPVANPRPWT